MPRTSFPSLNAFLDFFSEHSDINDSDPFGFNLRYSFFRQQIDSWGGVGQMHAIQFAIPSSRAILNTVSDLPTMA